MLVLGAVWLVRVDHAAGLPRGRLADGGEFRVLQVTYGAGDASMHHLGRAPAPLFWLWRALPNLVRGVVPSPNEGLTSEEREGRAISIWLGWFDSSTNKPLLGPADDPMLTLDSGERVNLGWILPAQDSDLRQMFVCEPSQDSKRLHISLWLNEQWVEFALDNPAFTEGAASKRQGGHAFMRAVAIPIFPEGERPGEGIAFALPQSTSARKGVEELQLEYFIINHYKSDVFVAVEPPDDMANSFPALEPASGPRDSSNPTKLRYALLPCARKGDGDSVTHSTARKALISLRNPLESGGRFHLCVYIEGYFRDTGQPFFGSTYVDLPVTIVE